MENNYEEIIKGLKQERSTLVKNVLQLATQVQGLKAKYGEEAPGEWIMENKSIVEDTKLKNYLKAVGLFCVTYNITRVDFYNVYPHVNRVLILAADVNENLIPKYI
jgi:hypothetical protein